MEPLITLPEKEILDGPVALCDERGRLLSTAVGWSRHPLHHCNLRGAWGRKKRWNYWCITSPTHLFSATISTLDYAGLGFVYVLDFESGAFHEQTVLVPLARGIAMPETVGADVVFDDRRLRLAFTHRPGGIHLSAQSPDFGGRPLSAEIDVDYPGGHETLSVVVPWSENRFQFTSKHHALPAGGEVEALGQMIRFDRSTAFACLDFGRGLWPYSSFWNWAGGSGRTAGHTIGLNLGSGWTDGTGATENGFVVDGRLTKIGEDLRFEYDAADFMKPWTIRTSDGDYADLTFTPFYERVARSNLLLIRSEVHQCIGRFSGTIRTGDDERLDVRDLVGWAEEHQARW